MTVKEFKIEVLPVKNRLFRLALRMLRNRAEAEDTVQDTFLKLWDRRYKLKEYKSIEAFAMVITKNLCLDKLKSPKSKKNELLEPDLKISAETPDKELEMKESINNVHQIIEMLPEQQRLVIQLRDIEGYEFEEIADMADMNLNAVRVNLSRARKKIREELIKRQDYEYSSY